MHWLDKIPFSLLVILSLTLGFAPFTPVPHLIEKIVMLVSGNLNKPIDIFDLIMHASPIALLVMKMGRSIFR
ncbi:RND transporter [Desulfopila sp. IMCC35006]|uniref:RND transporter n=1 Tax=Desulfopila sp. IMCC35006 TaxID=2569542 RepID=UPI0010AC88AC|nr:RND transporter [Desulfopila sp. IMCC35006]TKB25568.1 RND transporter [Desulfopila sp. IMCC35006]